MTLNDFYGSYGGFEIGDKVALHDPAGDDGDGGRDGSPPIVGRLVQAADVPKFMFTGPDKPSFNPESGHFDGPPNVREGDLTVFGIWVEDPVVVGDLDGHPYPVSKSDVDDGWLRRLSRPPRTQSQRGPAPRRKEST